MQSRKDPRMHHYALKKQEEMTNKILLTLPLFHHRLLSLVVALFTSSQLLLRTLDIQFSSGVVEVLTFNGPAYDDCLATILGEENKNRSPVF